MKIKVLQRSQKIGSPVEEAWNFFSNPRNLAKITPPEMGFELANEPDDDMYPGMIIVLKIGIAPGIKSTWVTEITQVRPQKYFVDEQRFGPYKMWHHEHIFEKIPGGCEIIDRVHYALPVSPFGDLFAGGAVAKRLNKIFNFRRESVAEIFKPI